MNLGSQEASVRYTELKHMTIKDMKTGQTATILKVGGEAALRQHFLDMGLIQGAEVTVIKYAPMGDPVELRIHGYELTIRLADAAQIEVSTVHDNEKQEKTDIKSMNLEELKSYMESIGEKPFRAKQLYEWMHEKQAASFDEMTNLSKSLQ